MLKFDRNGLIPAVIQDDMTGEVLMVAFMNEEAFRLTRETGYSHFFSRSRNTIWRKGEQSGHEQHVRAIYVNCEENSLLVRVLQRGEAACHMGYRSCYHRRLLPDGAYDTVAERLFDPAVVYAQVHAPQARAHAQYAASLEALMRRLYTAYLYLRDHDLGAQSNTSRLLHERNTAYLVSRIADELQELAGVQSGQHLHNGRQPDTILEGSQVGYWLFLLAASNTLAYDDFTPHAALLRGYTEQHSQMQQADQQICVDLLTSHEPARLRPGLDLGFALIGRACAAAGVSPLSPAEYDLEQMRHKGLRGLEL